MKSKLKARRGKARLGYAEPNRVEESHKVRATYKVNYYYLRDVIEERTIRFSGGQPTAGAIRKAHTSARNRHTDMRAYTYMSKRILSLSFFLTHTNMYDILADDIPASVTHKVK